VQHKKTAAAGLTTNEREMKQIKIFRDRAGAEVRLFKDSKTVVQTKGQKPETRKSSTFVVRIRGPKTEPRIYRDENGRVYGIERFSSPGNQPRYP
jgi:hypothetical protein